MRARRASRVLRAIALGIVFAAVLALMATTITTTLGGPR